jgi:D-lactate dehydrogenase (cytochrome)
LSAKRSRNQQKNDQGINKTLGRDGLFFPPGPGAAATIGGMIGNNASGIRSVKYGATKDYVMRLTVVLPEGDVIHVGNRARKSSSGYNLPSLFTGSEGTLGIITEANLSILMVPARSVPRALRNPNF